MNNQKLYMETALHQRLTNLVLDLMKPEGRVPMMIIWSEPGMGKTTWIREHLVKFFERMVMIHFHRGVNAENLWSFSDISYNAKNQQELKTRETDALAVLTAPGEGRKLLILEEIHISPGGLYALNGLGSDRAQISITEGNLGTRGVTNAAVVMTSNVDPSKILEEEFMDRCTVVNLKHDGLTFFTPDNVIDTLELSAGIRYLAPIIMECVTPNIRPSVRSNARQWRMLFSYIDSFSRQGEIMDAVRSSFNIHLGKGIYLMPGVSPQSVFEAFKALYEERLMDL